MLAACEEAGVRTTVAWDELESSEKDFVWSGPGFTNLDRFFARLQRKIYRMHVRILLARYRSYETCPDCCGKRLTREALAVKIGGETVVDLLEKSVEDLRAWVEELDSNPPKSGAEPIVLELRKRLDVLHRVGLDYLSFVRQSRTLSGGESQRIHLASALASGLTGTLYVLDEPTIGLHPADTEKLLSLLEDLARKGNTVLVVEHDRKVIEGADHVIDLGPGAGEHGGRIVAEGTLSEVLASGSLTARYLNDDQSALADREASTKKDLAQGGIVGIRGARENNLQGIDVHFPLGCLVAVTGVSGSGKSTLMENVLYGTYQRSRGVVDVEPGACDGLSGLDAVEDVVLVDQRPLGRSSRSNPATYTKAYDDIRKLYAKTDLAKQRGVDAGSFSFNLDKGRCSACQGTGFQMVDLHFMEPVRVICEDCDGRRFRRDILEITVDGRSIDATLDLTVQEAVEVFASERRLCRKLQSLLDVGLGYLRLGQTTTTLSGGEAQRLKLARFLDRRPGSLPHLFLFDEPTTGLHMADIDRLHQTLRRLIEMGDGVVVIEHSPDLVARADWIIDLGPGGGSRGGRLLFSGPMADFLATGESPTSRVLRDHLGPAD
jgi:excinuclease ABC subunit A